MLDFGKIRAGYAKVGRDAGPYNVDNVFVLDGGAFLGQPTGGVSPNSKGGKSLQPEFTKELELMKDLLPELQKLAQGREIAGLNAYEER